MRPITLTTGLGEVMAPQTLVTALIVAPDGAVVVDPGALHGRSIVESSILRFVGQRNQVTNAQRYWCVWVAVELDSADHPIRYRGVTASGLWVDPVNQLGYKVLAEAVNRMSQAMQGVVNLKALEAKDRAAIGQQLHALNEDVWERSPTALMEALG